MIIGLILTGCVVLLTYYFAVVLKELAERLKESKSVVANVDEITVNVLESQRKISGAVESIENIATGIEESFTAIREQFLIPFSYIMRIVQQVQEYFGNKKEESKISEEE